MQHLNYCRQMLRERVPLKEPGHGNLNMAARIAAGAQKFLLPEGGILLWDAKLKALDLADDLRLPFPAVALEWRDDEGGRHIDVFHEELESITLQRVMKIPGWPWIASPPLVMQKVGYVSELEGGQLRVNWRWQDGKGDPDYPVGAPVEGFARLLMLLNAMACANVHVERSDPPKLRAKIKSAHPFDSYHILTIDVPHGASAAAGEHGSHRSPREHLRRGHIRRYETGLKVWVNATVVNPGIGGKVSKDYRVRA